MKCIGLFALAVLLAACSAAASPGATAPAGPTAAAGQSAASRDTSAPASQVAGSGGGGASVLANARAVQHFCTLLPTDLVKAIVPDGGTPQEMQFPPTCSVYGTKTAMAIELDAFVPLSATPAGAETVAGLGTGAHLEHLSPGNFYLSISLSPEAGVLHVEVDNQDGKDHKDEAVNVAKALLAKLGG